MLGPLRLPPPSFEFADGNRQSFAVAYGWCTERETYCLSCARQPHNCSEGIRMPRAKVGPDPLKTEAVHKEQFGFIYRRCFSFNPSSLDVQHRRNCAYCGITVKPHYILNSDSLNICLY